ncbi:MAG: two pore domain potassium channel family protein [Colwellia sp.]|nr:two pore domain potassium channel family protein [Colwellia sp.]
MSIIFNAVAQNSKLFSVDEFGVKNYKTRFITLMSITLMISLVLSFGYVTYLAEIGQDGATIKNFGDAVWLMIMSSTTIGFGSQYPTTDIGRIMVTLMFVFGVGIMGGLGALIATKVFGFSDTNVKNRELRQQNTEIYDKLMDIEKLLSKNKPK